MTDRRPAPDILCIGSVLWDVIGRSNQTMRVGSDVPGRIVREPGGVAMIVAMTLARLGMRPGILTVLGQDAAGEDLARRAADLGIDIRFVYRSEDLPTDTYMAVEGGNGLIAAIADAHSLEQAGARVLAPLKDGRLGSDSAPWRGKVALDGNLTEALLRQVASDPALALADLRVAPASPGKAQRLLPLIDHPGATLYLNREEAGLLCLTEFDSAEAAAEGLRTRGATRVLVTDGGRAVAEAGPDGLRRRTPPPVMVTRVTGAGDTFMAAHIAAEDRGADPDAALDAALAAAVAYVAGDRSS